MKVWILSLAAVLVTSSSACMAQEPVVVTEQEAALALSILDQVISEGDKSEVVMDLRRDAQSTLQTLKAQK